MLILICVGEIMSGEIYINFSAVAMMSAAGIVALPAAMPAASFLTFIATKPAAGFLTLAATKPAVGFLTLAATKLAAAKMAVIKGILLTDFRFNLN